MTKCSDGAIDDTMMKENKIYITASELSELLGISLGHAYKLIRNMNKELEESGYMIVAGKLPRKYFEKRWFGYGT